MKTPLVAWMLWISAGLLRMGAQTPDILTLGKGLGDALGARPFATGLRLKVLVNVGPLKLVQSLNRMIQTGAGKSPGANRGGHQVHRLCALRQPFAKHKSIERSKHQALGAAGRSRHHAHVVRAQAVRSDVSQRFGAGIEAQGIHAGELRSGQASVDGFDPVPNRPLGAAL